MLEHALRCSEVAALGVEDIDLIAGTITILRKKTRTNTEQQTMKTHTRLSAERYLALLQKTEGPLFRGYSNQRLTERVINARVAELGKQLGVAELSPHDLRHFWAGRCATQWDATRPCQEWRRLELDRDGDAICRQGRYHKRRCENH